MIVELLPDLCIFFLQVIYSHYPPAYVVGPLPGQAVLQQVFRGNQLSAWSNTPAAAHTDNTPHNFGRLSSSDDDVFLPSHTRTSHTQFYPAPYLSCIPPPSGASSGPETPKFNFATTMEAFCPGTPGIRLPEKYTRGRGKLGVRKPSSRKPKRRSANGSLNSSGGTSGSSHNTTGHSLKQNSSGPDLQLTNLSDVTTANTSGSVGSPPGPGRRHLERSVTGEMSSVSSCVLPMSLRAALNDDPPEPTTAGAPLKTSSPIRASDEFLSLPTIIPTTIQKAGRHTLRPPPLPIGAEMFHLKQEPKEKKSEEKKSGVGKEKGHTAEGCKPRKRRDGRVITGSAMTVVKIPRVSTSQDEEDVEDGELEDMDQCLRILKQRELTGAAEEQARRREEFLLVLEAERERQRRLVLPRKVRRVELGGATAACRGGVAIFSSVCILPCYKLPGSGLNSILFFKPFYHYEVFLLPTSS